MLVVARIALFIGIGIAALLAAGAVYEAWARRVAAGRTPPPGQMADIGEGRRLHIFCEGDAPGPTVVLEMGAAEASPFFWAIQHDVSQFARVCSYDRAGLGWSPPVRGAQTMEERAADLHAMLQAAGIPGPYVLAGHSYGGPLIRLFARDHPHLAAGFVFIDAPDEASLFGEPYQRFLRSSMIPMVRVMGLARRFGVLRALAAISPNLSFMPPNMAADARRAMAATEGPGLYRTAAMEFESILTAPDRLRTGGLGGPLGDAPVIVLTHGIKFPPPYDVLEMGWEEGQARLAALSTNSELVVATQSSHLLQYDEPDLVIDAIRRVWLAARDGSPLERRAPVR
jgi:pimeloyl-ACP methyl ester carboxylesterase